MTSTDKPDELPGDSHHNVVLVDSSLTPPLEEVEHPEMEPLLAPSDTRQLPDVVISSPEADDPPLKQMETSENTVEDDASLAEVGDHVQHPLLPIIEHEVMDFKVEEVIPNGKYPMITNNVTRGIDESFLHVSQASLWEEQATHRANTMQNLHERNSFLNLTSTFNMGKIMQRSLLHLKGDMTFGSVVAINKMTVQEHDKNSLVGDHKPIKVVASGNYMKNLLAMCFTITLIFIALGSVRNLQSSINHEGGLGVICLAVSFAGYMVAGLISPIIVQNINPRRCLIAGIVPHVIYTASNVYPAAWLMAPSAFAQGVSLAIIWNTMSTYITLLAKGSAEQTNAKYPTVSGRYFGIFGLLYQSYFIVGNLISALVLQYASQPAPSETIYVNGGNFSQFNNTGPRIHSTTANLTTLEVNIPSSTIERNFPNLSHLVAPGSRSTNGDDPPHIQLCGAKFWQHYDLGGDQFYVSNETKYLLFGIYVLITVAAMLIAIFVLEDLNPRLFESSVPVVEKLKSQLWSLLVFFIDPRCLLIFPLLMFSYMQVGFVTAEVTKSFITCPLGIYMVGYTMMFLGIFGSLISYVSGMVTRYIGRVPQSIVASCLNMGVLLFLLQWEPTTDTYIPYFVVMGFWGAADGIWVSQINSMLGIIFPDKFEEAFAVLRVAQGLGVAVIFGTSNAMRMDSKIYFLMMACVFGISCFLIMEVYIRKTFKKNMRIIRQTSV